MLDTRKYMLPSFNRNNSGQILIDIIVATGVFMILIHAIFSITVVIYQTIGYSRNRISARHIASEKIEVLKNLAYNDVGTTTGIPNGIIPEFETLDRNGLNYFIHTTITYVDDPYDNLAPQDLLPTDYKSVRVSVDWEGISGGSNKNPIVLVSNISPKGLETSIGGGTISIIVINSLAKPVEKAQVHIINSDIIPKIDMTLQTNSEGRILLPGASPCSTCYNIEVTKNNYSSDKTYTSDEVSNPNKKPITVIKGDISELTFVIDQISKLNLNSYHPKEQNFTLYPNITFRITGNKTIGTDVNGDPVYKFDKNFTTNSNANYLIENLEWDSYILTIPSIENKTITGIYPHQPFSLNPNEVKNLDFSLTNYSINNLLLSIVDASSSAIASVSATLNLNNNLVATKSSGLKNDPDFGQIFFDNLNVSDYSFTLTHPEYNKSTGTITINGNIKDKVILNKKI